LFTKRPPSWDEGSNLFQENLLIQTIQKQCTVTTELHSSILTIPTFPQYVCHWYMCTVSTFSITDYWKTSYFVSPVRYSCSKQNKIVISKF
jgi:hypothetical protein